MKITIVGAGNMGTGYGALWAAAGHEITYTYASTVQRLRDAVAATDDGNGRIGYDIDPASAAAGADLVVLTIPWGRLDDVTARLGPLDGMLVVDAFTPLAEHMSGLEIGHTTSGAERLAQRIPSARIVCALQNTFADIVHAPDRTVGGQTPTMFFCGDDDEGKQQVAELIRQAGFDPVDAGPLTVARYLEPFCFFAVHLAYRQGYGSSLAMKLLRPAGQFVTPRGMRSDGSDSKAAALPSDRARRPASG